MIAENTKSSDVIIEDTQQSTALISNIHQEQVGEIRRKSIEDSELAEFDDCGNRLYTAQDSNNDHVQPILKKVASVYKRTPIKST